MNTTTASLTVPPVLRPSLAAPVAVQDTAELARHARRALAFLRVELVRWGECEERVPSRTDDCDYDLWPADGFVQLDDAEVLELYTAFTALTQSLSATARKAVVSVIRASSEKLTADDLQAIAEQRESLLLEAHGVRLAQDTFDAVEAIVDLDSRSRVKEAA
jgi:hypothetical protein